ncbi:MAG: hypothetical protein ACPHQD_13210 [Vibrio toranzoniae]|uniref:hypothetical protein n=1 Tax=Vibrio toranzoniae TaxID=1194427 RepID=UPI003C6B1499
MMWQSLIGPVANLAGGWLKNKAEEKQAKHEARLSVIQNEADWESKMADASANSWKDEWFTILLSLPLLSVAYSVIVADSTIVARVKEGFEALNLLPDWYQYMLFLAVSASFGIKGADKIMSMRKK